MLFLYRPRQTRIPIALPRSHSEQAEYNRRLQERFDSTRRTPPAVPAADHPEPVAQLKQLGALRESGLLTDAEFEAAKAKVLAG